MLRMRWRRFHRLNPRDWQRSGPGSQRWWRCRNPSRKRVCASHACFVHLYKPVAERRASRLRFYSDFFPKFCQGPPVCDAHAGTVTMSRDYHWHCPCAAQSVPPRVVFRKPSTFWITMLKPSMSLFDDHDRLPPSHLSKTPAVPLGGE